MECEVSPLYANYLVAVVEHEAAIDALNAAQKAEAEADTKRSEALRRFATEGGGRRFTTRRKSEGVS